MDYTQDDGVQAFYARMGDRSREPRLPLDLHWYERMMLVKLCIDRQHYLLAILYQQDKEIWFRDHSNEFELLHFLQERLLKPELDTYPR